jgi:FHS family L-fucose permease-like MFS transporter
MAGSAVEAMKEGDQEMAAGVPTEPVAAENAHHAPSVYRGALAMLATLFFMWGFITVINNTLLPHLRSVFDLNYTQTTLIESVWFVAYFVASIPSAKLIERIGYRAALVVGLVIRARCFWGRRRRSPPTAWC